MYATYIMLLSAYYVLDLFYLSLIYYYLILRISLWGKQFVSILYIRKLRHWERLNNLSKIAQYVGEPGPSYVCLTWKPMLSVTVFNDFIDMKYVVIYYMKKGYNVISFSAYKNLPEGYILKRQQW